MPSGSQTFTRFVPFPHSSGADTHLSQQQITWIENRIRRHIEAEDRRRNGLRARIAHDKVTLQPAPPMIPVAVAGVHHVLPATGQAGGRKAAHAREGKSKSVARLTGAENARGVLSKALSPDCGQPGSDPLRTMTRPTSKVPNTPSPRTTSMSKPGHPMAKPSMPLPLKSPAPSPVEHRSAKLRKSLKAKNWLPVTVSPPIDHR